MLYQAAGCPTLDVMLFMLYLMLLGAGVIRGYWRIRVMLISKKEAGLLLAQRSHCKRPLKWGFILVLGQLGINIWESSADALWLLLP